MLKRITYIQKPLMNVHVDVSIEIIHVALNFALGLYQHLYIVHARIQRGAGDWGSGPPTC